MKDFSVPPTVERLVSLAVPRKGERETFLRFLHSDQTDGRGILESVQLEVSQEVERLIQSGYQAKGLELENFVTANLKITMNTNLNAYDFLTRKIIEKEKPHFGSLHRQIDTGKFDGKLPFGYPDVAKKAEGLLRAKIKDSLGIRTQKEYLEYKLLEKKIRYLVKEMFLGINKFGLEGENLTSYLKIVFELERLEEAPKIRSQDFKKMVVQALSEGKLMNLVHVKCLRFIYPKEGGVKILTDTQDVVIRGVQGEYCPKSEKDLFYRLRRIRNILTVNGIQTDFTIIIADEDIELLYPSGNPLVSNEQKTQAYEDMKKYVSFLIRSYSSEFRFKTISHLSCQIGESYYKYKQMVSDDINRFGGKFIDPHFFDRDRVNHQFEYYQKLFGEKYTRDEARRSITAQTASYIALEKLLPLLGENIVLVEENRGGENKLIASGEFPIVFIKLRDEAKFDVE